MVNVYPSSISASDPREMIERNRKNLEKRNEINAALAANNPPKPKPIETRVMPMQKDLQSPVFSTMPLTGRDDSVENIIKQYDENGSSGLDKDEIAKIMLDIFTKGHSQDGEYQPMPGVSDTKGLEAIIKTVFDYNNERTMRKFFDTNSNNEFDMEDATFFAKQTSSSGDSLSNISGEQLLSTEDFDKVLKYGYGPTTATDQIFQNANGNATNEPYQVKSNGILYQYI